MSSTNITTVLKPKYNKGEILDLGVKGHREVAMILGRQWDLFDYPKQWVYEILYLNGHVDWITEASLTHKVDCPRCGRKEDDDESKC